MTGKEQPQSETQQRIDKWLFFTRLLKSRSLAQSLVSAGGVSVNGRSVTNSSYLVRPGDSIELMLEHRDVRLVVRGCGTRRGPPEEARRLYAELAAEAEPKRLTPFERAQRRPRPTERRGGT